MCVDCIMVVLFVSDKLIYFYTYVYMLYLSEFYIVTCRCNCMLFVIIRNLLQNLNSLIFKIGKKTHFFPTRFSTRVLSKNFGLIELVIIFPIPFIT